MHFKTIIKTRLSLAAAMLWLGTVLSFSQSQPSQSGPDMSRIAGDGGITAAAVQKDSLVLTITENSLISTSHDGVEWECMDFNSTYSDYYGWTVLTHAAASDYDFMVLGIDAEGLPVAYTSARGRVWSPRPLEYPVGGVYERLREEPAGLLYDTEHDRYEVVLENGDRLLLPACSHCNRLVKGAATRQ